MASFIVLYHISGDMDFMFGSGQKLVGRVAEFDGTMDEASSILASRHFTVETIRPSQRNTSQNTMGFATMNR